MAHELNGKRVAILVTDGFEQVELTGPREALDKAGAKTVLVSPKGGQVQGWNHTDKGDAFPVDLELSAARPDQFDALVLPGGVHNPDTLRINKEAVAFAKSFFDAGKPVAAICHGPWTLINAGVVKGRELTSWPSLEMDLRNAGATWVDREVVVSKGLVTSRKPDDLAAFNRETITLFAKGVQAKAA